MILLFGGTTEGRNIASLLDAIGEDYFYSTRTGNIPDVGGTVVSGEMDAEQIASFCREKEIRLIIDAAHPFAVALHRNIHKAASALDMTTIRFERPRLEVEGDEPVRFFDSFSEMVSAVLNEGYQNILALTGVQTIPALEPLWKQRSCYFRILDTTWSRRRAEEAGIPSHLVFPMHPDGDTDKLISLAREERAEVLLSKESGSSGFMESKLAVACALNIPLWVVQRPALPAYSHVVEDRKQLLQILFQLRKTVLKRGRELRSGYSTGTCVTAAAKASFIALMEGKFPERVEAELPDGGIVSMVVFPGEKTKESSSCVVIKDAGGDPDVTHAREIGCKVSRSPHPGVHFLQGTGIGKVTIPGLQVDVGEPAINPMPRTMITGALEKLADVYEEEPAFDVEPFIPGGEELARKTFNPRVGVEGGLSVLGTTGRVVPFSNEAFVASIEQQLSVLASGGGDEVVLTSGKRSENDVRDELPHLPDMGFVHFGNLIGPTLEKAVAYGFRKIHLAIRFGKGVKLAAGYLDTHSRHVAFDPDFLADIAATCGCSSEQTARVKKQKLANAVTEMLPFAQYPCLYYAVARKCFDVCTPLLPEDAQLRVVLLINDHYRVVVPEN